MTISSEVDARTLREISLVPFEAAVLEAGTWSVMTAYNRLHGTYCSEHPLLNDLLKRRVGLRRRDHVGLVRHAQHRARGQRGLDLEMPGPPQWFGDAPRRRGARRRGRREGPRRQGAAHAACCSNARAGSTTPDFGPEQSIDDPEDRAVARRAAAESFVLLHNRDGCRSRSSRRGDEPAAARGDRPERGARDDPGRRQRARARSSRRSRRSPGCASASATRSASSTSAAARASSRRRCSTRRVLDGPLAGRVLRGPRARGRARARRAGRPRLVHVHRAVHARGARRVLDAHLGHGGRARDRARGRSGSCRSAGPGSRSTARSSSTTGSRPGAARRSWASRAPRSPARSSSSRASRTQLEVEYVLAGAVDGRARDRVHAAGAARPARPRGRARGARRRGRVRRRHRRRLGDRGQRPRRRWRCRRRRTSSCARSRR